MKQFTELYLELDSTTRITERQRALVRYFERSSDSDKLWLIALFTGKRPRRTINTSLLKEWAMEVAGIAPWLFEQSYHIVGDLAETISLLIPPSDTPSEKSLTQYIKEIRRLGDTDDEEKKAYMIQEWENCTKEEIFILNKLITGGFRLGVSQKTIVKALATHTGREENVIAHRLMGDWHPDQVGFNELLLSEDLDDDISRPYPFYLAYALESEPNELGSENDWIAERKWDGIRGQIIVRNEQVFVWSRGEELLTDRFPEFQPFSALPDGTVLDGEILGFKDKPLQFNQLQKRIGRKNLTDKILKEVPVILYAYDLLEWQGQDIREYPFHERRTLLESLSHTHKEEVECLRLSPTVHFSEWAELYQHKEEARQHLAEGLMLKRRDSGYGVGRKKGNWWKWKVDPLTIDAVLLYAMRGHGRRSNLYTDYTFAVWNGKELVPFTKAYSGLTDKEIIEVDRFVKANTLERFGPVRSVAPQLVFEIGFEGISKSTRHKSGVALRFPRMLRWRRDKPVEEANTLSDLTSLLNIYEAGE